MLNETKRVTEISAQDKNGIPALKRVCAYIRVSTGHDAQLLSLKAQKEYYTELLSNRPGCVFIGIFADEGISGGKEERPGFSAMMAAAAEGKIDLVVTKSISRFARNTLFFLKSVRTLTRFGVCIYFEKENVYSISKEGELMMSLYAVFAEEERKQVCGNVRWSIHKKYESGESLLNPSRIFGYSESENGGWLIDETQAQTVRRIYKRYLDGALPREIADELNTDGTPSDTGHPWSDSRILNIIKNEKYKGDCLLQKSYIDRNGIQVKNCGEYSQFYVEGNHPPIVTKDVWEQANARAKQRGRKTFPFSGRLHCPYCEKVLRRQKSPWCVTWQCSTYLTKGKSVCIGIPLREQILLEIAGEEHSGGHWTVKEVVDGDKKSFILVPYGTNGTK